MSSSSQQPSIVVEQARENALGMAGFVISIIGFLTCGFISPLGALLSFLGVFSRPRGMALTGLILGILGSAWLFFAGFAIVAGILGLGAAVNEVSKAQTAAVNAKAEMDAAGQFDDDANELAEDMPVANDALTIDLNEDAAVESAEIESAETEPAGADTETSSVEPTPEDATPEKSTSAIDQPTERGRPDLEWHEFTDATGQYHIKAQLTGFASGTATLLKEDGSETKVPIDRLSEADQEWIRAEIRRRSR